MQVGAISLFNIYCAWLAEGLTSIAASAWPRLHQVHMEIQCYHSEKLQCSLCFLQAKEKSYTASLPCFTFSHRCWVLLCPQ